MPIQGLGKNRRYPRAGVLKIGKKEGNRPVALDHFLVNADNADAVHAVYGENPKRIDIFLPDNLTTAVWDANYKYYTTNGLYCKGDGITGRYIENGEMKERPCADRGCPFPVGDKPKCRPTGILSFRIVDVDSVGIYQVTLRGMMNIERLHGFLLSLQEAAGGNLTGIPFGIQVEQVTSAKRKFYVINAIETEATTRALATGDRLSKGEAPTEVVEDYIITDEDGDLAATMQVPEGEEIGARAEFAELLHDAISKFYLVGQTKSAYLKVLSQLVNMEEEEAEERLAGLKEWIASFEATKDEPVSNHKSDARMAAAVFKHMTDEQFASLGIDVPAEPGDLTRIEVRKATDFLTSVPEEA